MKRLLIPLVAGGVLFLYVAPIWNHRSSATKFSVGPALPPGKVTPQLAHANDQALLLAPDGSLWGWGESQIQQVRPFWKTTAVKIPRRLSAESDWCQIAVVSSFLTLLALKTDGSLWSGTLTNWFATPVRFGVETNWLCISCGSAHCLALQKDGTLWAWGRNDEGELGDGTTKSEPVPTRIGQDADWKSIAAGGSTSFALKTDGTVWGWGPFVHVFLRRGTYDCLPGILDYGTNWVAIRPSGPSLLALKSDGTLWFRNMSSMDIKPRYRFIQIGQDHDWQDAHAEMTGLLDFFAGKRDGSQWGWGPNHCAELGTGNSSYVPFPRQLPFAFDPWALSSGSGNTVLLAKDGTLWTWGVRVGAPRPGPGLLRLKKLVNDSLQGMIHRPLFDLAPIQIDPLPYHLWTLPAEVQRSLGKAQAQ